MSNSLITELTIPTLPISSSNIYFLPYFFVLGKDVDAVESALLTNCDEAAREEVQQIANYFRVVPLIKRETDQHDLLEDGTTGTALARYLGILEEGSEIWRLDVTEVLTLMCIVISRGVRTVDVTVTELVRRCESEVGQGRREEGVFFVVDILRRLMGCLPKVKGEIMDAVVKEVNDESEIVKQLSITHPRLLLRSLSRLHRHHSLFVATVLHHNDFTYVLPTLTTTYFHNPSSSTLNALHALKPHLLNIASEINLRCIILLRCIGVPFSGSDLQPFMELYTRMYPPHGPRHGVSSLSSLVLPFSLAFLVQIKELPILSTLLEACLVPAVLNLVFPALKLRELEKECGKRLGVIGEEVRLPRECMAALQEVVRAYLGDPWTLPSLLSDTEPVHVSLLMYILNLVTSPVDIKEYLNAILCPDAPPWEHRVSDEDLEALISVCEYQQKHFGPPTMRLPEPGTKSLRSILIYFLTRAHPPRELLLFAEEKYPRLWIRLVRVRTGIEWIWEAESGDVPPLFSLRSMFATSALDKLESSPIVDKKQLLVAFPSVTSDSYYQQQWLRIWKRTQPFADTIRLLLPNNCYSVLEIIQNPTLLFVCHEDVLTDDVLVVVFLGCLRWALSEFRKRVKAVNFQRENDPRVGELNEAEEKVLRKKCVEVVECACVQLLMDVLVRIRSENTDISNENDQQKGRNGVQRKIYDHLHSSLLASPHLIGYIIHQGIPVEIVPDVIAGVPSLHVTLSHIPLLFQHLSPSDSEKTRFTMTLLRSLCETYKIEPAWRIVNDVALPWLKTVAANLHSDSIALLSEVCDEVVRVACVWEDIGTKVKTVLGELVMKLDSESSLQSSVSNASKETIKQAWGRLILHLHSISPSVPIKLPPTSAPTPATQPHLTTASHSQLKPSLKRKAQLALQSQSATPVRASDDTLQQRNEERTAKRPKPNRSAATSGKPTSNAHMPALVGAKPVGRIDGPVPDAFHFGFVGDRMGEVDREREAGNGHVREDRVVTGGEREPPHRQDRMPPPFFRGSMGAVGAPPNRGGVFHPPRAQQGYRPVAHRGRGDGGMKYAGGGARGRGRGQRGGGRGRGRGRGN